MEYFTIELISTVLKVLIISFVLSDLSKFVGELLSNVNFKIHKSKSLFTIVNSFKLLFSYMLICEKCFSFWFSLIYTGDLFISAVISLLVAGLKELQSRFQTKL